MHGHSHLHVNATLIGHIKLSQGCPNRRVPLYIRLSYMLRVDIFPLTTLHNDDIIFLYRLLQLDSLGHYTVYALEGRAGEVRWHLTPKDFQFNPAFSPVRYLWHLLLVYVLYIHVSNSPYMYM